MSTYVSYQEELEQEPFDAVEFIERLVWRSTGGTLREDTDKEFNADLLKQGLEQAITDLEALRTNIDADVEVAEKGYEEEKGKFYNTVQRMNDRWQAAYTKFQQLDERLNSVATKVVPLGDQLENISTPRMRAVEAQRLFLKFNDFVDEEKTPEAHIPSKLQELQEEADTIQKLYLIAQEMPAKTYELAIKRIEDRYSDIEKALINMFVQAQDVGDREVMKELATTMSNFKGYNQCIDAFIGESQRDQSFDVFTEVVPLCHKTSKLVEEVFTTPENVMAKFVLNIYHGKIREQVQMKLQDRTDTEKYLKTLYDLYCKTCRLSQDLGTFKLGNDPTFLSKLTKNIFHKHLETYISVETKFVKEKFTVMLRKFYESRGHQKKYPITGGLQQELRVRIGSPSKSQDQPGETLVSEALAVNMLDECKMAYKRCQALSNSVDLPSNALMIFEALTQYLCVEHVDYALEFAIHNIVLESRSSPPDMMFLDICHQCNGIYHLFQKQFSDSLIPLVSSSPRHADCLHKNKEVMERIESRLDTGLDKTLTSMVNWVRHVLTVEQKKADFKPESEEITQLGSEACKKVVPFVRRCHSRMRDCVDGKNLDANLTEFGISLHRAIYEHLLKFEYNSVGAMIVICDVNEYRKCTKEFSEPLVTKLFELLHALCNLLVVVPENIKDVCENQLSGVDANLINTFLQLRADYKNSKLHLVSKQLSEKAAQDASTPPVYHAITDKPIH